MTPALRLVARPTLLPRCFSLSLEFAATDADEAGPWGPAMLEFGDGQVLDLGVLCLPTATTWRAQRSLSLGEHTYAGAGTGPGSGPSAAPGPFTARLLVGNMIADTVVYLDATPGATVLAARSMPDLLERAKPVLSIEAREGRALERGVQVAGVTVPDQSKLRLDGGAGQVYEVGGPLASGEGFERRMAYAKSGTYTVALDLLDKDGFWQATLAEQPVEISALPDEVGRFQAGRTGAVAGRYVPAGDQPSDKGAAPWLPFRYARASWSWLRTHANPGGTGLVRVLAAGTYLSIRSETVVGESLWYQTAAQDWVQASAVDLLQPSNLQGIPLQTRRPSPTASLALQPAVVSAALLNVRGQPGIRADNPPVRQLSAGAEIQIYEVARHGGSTWYRIGPADWVHTSGVRLARLETEPAVAATGLPAGWVVAPALNLRRRPGVSAANAPIGRVTRYQALPILETYTLGGIPWYRVGDEGWIESTWVAVAEPMSPPAQIGGNERWLAVSLNNQTVVAYEGECPVYAALAAGGLPATPTPTGLFSVYRQLEAGRVSGGNPGLGSYHDLEDVPWLSYFYSGYALLGAYWHDSFGRPRSHGCVNLSPYDAWWLYGWSSGNKLSVLIY